MTQNLTHADLVALAERWLRNGAKFREVAGEREYRRQVRCNVVLTEAMGGNGESPDAIGWAYGGVISVLVECKVSRADFFADQKKPFRQRPKFGLGHYRYYMVPRGLVAVEEVPEGWGLLYVHNGRARVIRLADQQEVSGASRRYEMQMLITELTLFHALADGRCYWHNRRIEKLAEWFGRSLVREYNG